MNPSDARERGIIDSLRFVPFTLPACAPGEVLIRVHAAGLNFRDVMWALGLLPDEALLDGFAGPTLGLECAGRVAASPSQARPWAAAWPPRPPPPSAAAVARARAAIAKATGEQQ